MKYLQYRLINLEPLRIADDSRSQSGQAVSLDYIPGSAVRGYIVNELAHRDHFEDIRKTLFSADVRFGNAYLSVVDENGTRRELIPSPKGFYEDKAAAAGEKAIQNVVARGDVRPGYKRASLGHYAYFQGTTIRYYNTDTGSDLKILINVDDKAAEGRQKRTVFRNDYIAPGTEFAGDIAVPDALVDVITSVWKDTVILGNARSAGYGKCRIQAFRTADVPLYTNYEITEDQQGLCYLYLVSNTTMRDAGGQYCGLNLSELERLLGVQKLKIDRCATSVVDVRGYNRQYGVKLPSVPMYQAGSVFRLTFDGTLTADRAAELLKAGIGIRRNEGFGRVLISKDYEALHSKLAGTSAQKTAGKKLQNSGSAPLRREDDKRTCHIIAGAWYRQQLNKEMLAYVTKNENFLKGTGASESQIGSLEAYTVGYRNSPSYAVKKIREFFQHAGEKEAGRNVHEQRSSVSGLGRTVLAILDQDLETTIGSPLADFGTIMDIPKEQLISKEELTGLKLDLVTMLIRFRNKVSREEKN